MKITYRKPSEYLKIEIDELRPKGSYQNLIENRTHSIDELIQQYGKIPEDLLIKRNCPTCNASNFKLVFSKDYMDIVSCGNCNLIYTNPIFNQEHYKETYKSKDYQEIVRELGEKSHDYRVNRFGFERIEIMEKFIFRNNQINYLDVGCSTGFVVEAAKSRGWNAVGIDLNPSAVEFGRTRGLNLENTALEDIDYDRGFFDVISMFDVLEHLPNPASIIEMSVQYLKPGGILFIYVPNWDSASRLLMGKDAHFIWPTHHLNYYTAETLGNFLGLCGLSTEFWITEGLDIIDYIWREEEINRKNMEAVSHISDKLQFFINAGGYGKNLRMLARKQ